MAAWFAAVAVAAAAAGVIFVLLLAPQRPAVTHTVPVPPTALLSAVSAPVQRAVQTAAPESVLPCQHR
jgi:hypothetical protein